MPQLDHYLIKGKKVPRVTTVLTIIHDEDLEKLQRVRGFNYVDRIFETKGDFGTKVHKILELSITGKLTKKTREMICSKQPEVYRRVLSFETYNKHKIKNIVSCEKRYNNEYNFAGTPDLVFMDEKGRRILGDWKTGIELWKHKLQIAAYWKMVEDKEGMVEEAVIWYIEDRKTKSVVLDRKELQMYYYYFSSALNIFNAKPRK